MTASRSYEVLRIDPVSGRKEVLADLSRERNFLRYDQIDDEEDGGKPWPQGGLMGMALHPLLLKGKPYVYLHYIYKFEGAEAKGNGKTAGEGFKFLSRIVRYVYDRQDRKLIHPEVLCDTIPSSNDHTGGRKLYLALDSIAVTSEPSKGFVEGKHCKGCILELRYKGGIAVQ